MTLCGQLSTRPLYTKENYPPIPMPTGESVGSRPSTETPEKKKTLAPATTRTTIS